MCVTHLVKVEVQEVLGAVDHLLLPLLWNLGPDEVRPGPGGTQAPQQEGEGQLVGHVEPE